MSNQLEVVIVNGIFFSDKVIQSQKQNNNGLRVKTMTVSGHTWDLSIAHVLMLTDHLASRGDVTPSPWMQY